MLNLPSCDTTLSDLLKPVIILTKAYQDIQVQTKAWMASTAAVLHVTLSEQQQLPSQNKSAPLTLEMAEIRINMCGMSGRSHGHVHGCRHT